MIEVQWTTGNLDEARRISRFLVEKRYVACAQITPWIESIYMWNNKLETTQESKVSMKTSEELFPKVKEFILANHSYEVPEIIVLPIQGGHEEYLAWAEESISISHD